MKIDVLGIEAFVAIAEQSSFHRAAAQLSITQTALSRRLQQLEAWLGVALVERTTRHVALTDTGREFLPQARRLLGELAGALVELRETGRARRGHVTIACVPTVGAAWLPAVLRAYFARFPDHRVTLLDQPSGAVADAVLAREAEFGIALASTPHADLVAEPLLRDPFVAACRRDHPLGRRRRIDWQALREARVILAGEARGNRPLLDAVLGGTAGERERARLQPLMEVNRSATALAMAARGLGVAIVPRLALARDDAPALRAVALERPTLDRELVLLSRRASSLSPAAQALQALVRRAAARSTA